MTTAISVLDAARATAIPMRSPQPDGNWAIGTGFLGRLSDELALFTAAHFPTNAQPVADANWTGWPNSVVVHVDDVETQQLDLFVEAAGLRTPLFRFRRASDEPRKLADMMAFRGPAYTEVLKVLRARYEPVQLVTSGDWSITVGDSLHCFGYPDRGGTTNWPYSPASTASGPFLGLAEGGMMLEASCNATKGFSGGPVFDDQAVFVGMVIGDTDDRSRIISGVTLGLLSPPSI